MTSRRNLRSAVLVACVSAIISGLAGAAQATADQLPDGVVVCNEAQSSPRGTWDATSSTDRVPPARHKDAAMPVGHGGGLLIAAEKSDALALCTPEPPDDGGGGDGGTT